MRRHGILHSRLAGLLAALGHTDRFVIGDAGLPVPPGVEVVDLAVVPGVPSFTAVLDAVLAEVVVEHAVLAVEALGGPAGNAITDRLPHAATVPHAELKNLCRDARFVVRTGEATPYANVVLGAGVAFS
ncbi:D-ribose pyranase [Pseudonocardia alni]|uniref:D-ribose pyranase n=1 Tax=Pseudonocardia alni TaxID=33907 RepID=UPI0033E1C7B6